MTYAEAVELTDAREHWDAARREHYKRQGESLKLRADALNAEMSAACWAGAAAGVALGLFFWWLVKYS